MRNLTINLIGCVLALWMSAGRWLFGLGGDLTEWYLALIAAPYVLLHLLATHRLTVAERRGRPIRRAAFGALWLSWLCAIGFGFTVPDSANGELMSIAGKFGGAVANDLAIALCNPLGIIAFALLIASLAFAIASGRPPRLDEDAILDAMEAAEAARADAGEPGQAAGSSGSAPGADAGATSRE